MLDFSRSRTPKQPPGSPLAPDLVLRVGFAGKRQLDEAQTETITTRLRDVFGVIGWRLVEISPMDDATNERCCRMNVYTGNGAAIRIGGALHN